MNGKLSNFIIACPFVHRSGSTHHFSIVHPFGGHQSTVLVAPQPCEQATHSGASVLGNKEPHKQASTKHTCKQTRAQSQRRKYAQRTKCTGKQHSSVFLSRERCFGAVEVVDVPISSGMKKRVEHSVPPQERLKTNRTLKTILK